MATNVGGILLGDIVLGIEDTGTISRSVTSTITFTQSIGKNFETINQSFSPIQDIVLQKIFGRSVTSNLNLTSLAQAPVYQSVTSTITFTQSISYDKSKPNSVSQSLGLSQTIAESHVATELVVSGITWTHTRSYNGVFTRTVSQNLGLNQNIVGDYCKVVTSLFNPTQTISYVKTKHVKHLIEFQQSFINPTTFARPINTIFPVFQTLTHNKILHLGVSQNITFTQTIVQARVKEVSQTLNLTQSIVGYRTNFAGNTLSLNQNLVYNHNSVRSINNPLTLAQTIGLTRTHSLEIHHGFGMNSFVDEYKIYYPSVTSNFNPVDQIRFSVYARTIAQNFNLAQTIGYTHVVPSLINQAFNLTQTIGVNRIITESLTDILTFPLNRTVYLGMTDGQYEIIDNIQYAKITASGSGSSRAKNRPHCVLQTNNAVILLPTPDWNDNENYDGIFSIRRSMNGIAYTTVRVLELRKLRLPFTLDESKAFELRQFLLQNNTKRITLTTWKGNKWFVYLTTNPMEFSKRGRYYNANEKVEVTLEFEGFKVM